MSTSIKRYGAGDDLVLIHGWAMHGGIFAPLSQRLATRFQVHEVDLPGHGDHRDYAHGDLDPARAARTLAAATPPALWVGWSLGGFVALRGALDHPQQVRGVVLIASSPRFVVADDWADAVPASVFAGFSSELEARFEHAIERFLALETLGAADAQEQLRALKSQVFARGKPSLAALREGLQILDAGDLRSELSRLGVPSLWIAGRRDRLVPPAAMRWAAQQAPRGRYLEMAAGHAPFLTHPDAVAEAIERFASELSA